MSTPHKEPIVTSAPPSPWVTRKQRLQGSAMLFLGISLFGLSVSGTLATAWLPLSALLLGTGIWWLQYPG